MKIRTLEELEDKFDKNLSWRKKEILSLKLLIESNESNRKLLLRSGIAILCAHFEGFIKESSNLYVIYIANNNIKCQDVIYPLLAIKLKGKIKECGETEKYSVYASMLGKIETIKENKFNLKLSENGSLVSTQANPTSNVLKEILKTLGLKSDIFDTKSKYIDYSLLKNRHKVVHGEKHEIDYNDFITVYEIVMKLMDEYRDLLIEAADKKLFLKQNCELEYA
ncbi:MAG: MAE_28990/MAE_18760 family HEPN-like nuclease [Fastidiosipilaceae bacterium]|jgi:hypothetical protein